MACQHQDLSGTKARLHVGAAPEPREPPRLIFWSLAADRIECLIGSRGNGRLYVHPSPPEITIKLESPTANPKTHLLKSQTGRDGTFFCAAYFSDKAGVPMSRYLSFSTQAASAQNEPASRNFLVYRRIGTMVLYAATILLVIVTGWISMGLLVPS